MAWGKMTKEELKAELGFDPDVFKTFDPSKVASVEALNEIKTQQDSIKATLDSLATTLQSRSTDNRGQQDDPPPPDNKPKEINNIDFMEDPVGNIKKLLQEVQAPVALHSMSVAADVAYDAAKRNLPYFDKFEEEIKTIWNKYPVQTKTNPRELIENIYLLVKGKHVDDIITDTNKKEGKYNLVQAGGTQVVRQANTPESKPEDSLSQDELRQASKFGMTPAEWAASKGGLKYA